MNQQEWLEYRRSLGLPADPEKDFPPSYRSDPKIYRGPDVSRNTDMTERQRRKAEATQEAARRASRAQQAPRAQRAQAPTPNTKQSAQTQRAMADALRSLQQKAGGTPPPAAPGRPTYGGQPTPGPRKKSNNPFGCCLLIVVIAIIVISYLIPGRGGLLDIFKPSGNTSSSNSYSTYQQKRNAEDAEQSKRAQAQAKEFMDSFVKGDADVVTALKETGSSAYDTSLLTPEQAEAAMGEDAAWEHSETSLIGAMANVDGYILTSSDRIPVSMRLLRTDDVWKPTGLRLPIMRAGNGRLPSELTINGVKVTIPEDRAYSGFLIWPGTTTVELPTGGDVTYAHPKQTLDATSEVMHMGIGQTLRIDVSPAR
ncbi:MAG: hypothetical protein ACTII7_08615 [Galactobacter sp.]